MQATTPQAQPSAPAFSFATLREVVAELEAAHPERGRRYQSAALIVTLRRIEEAAAGPGAWWVQSESGPSREYYVVAVAFERWVCNCADFQQRGGPCKHALAIQVLQACEARERGPEPPPLALPFCEADPDQPIPYELTEAALALLDAAQPAPAA